MTGKFDVAYASAAKEDLKSIYSYIARELKEVQTAKNQVNRIKSSIRSLERFPERHMVVDWEPWSSMGVHKMPVNRYVVFYLVNKEKRSVTVVRIFYGGQDVEHIVEESDESLCSTV